MGNINAEQLEEIIDALSYRHELVFRIDNNMHILQPEYGDLVMYSMEPTFKYLVRVPYSPESSLIDIEIIKEVLNKKVFDGLSFMDRIDDIWAEEIF